MIIYNKKTYSFNLPMYLGENYVSVDVVEPMDIHRITFYTPSGNQLLFSVFLHCFSIELLNEKTLAYIKLRIENETD
jgi:hypothetical protein